MSQNAPQMRALWILFISSVLWVRHARRLSLRDDTKSHFKEDCTFLFIRIRHSQDILSCIFWKSLICGVLCVDMQGVFLKISLMFTTKSYKSLSKTELSSLSLDLNQLVLQAQNTSVGATLRKTLRYFATFLSETIPIFFVSLSANIFNVLHSKVQ